MLKTSLTETLAFFFSFSLALSLFFIFFVCHDASGRDHWSRPAGTGDKSQDMFDICLVNVKSQLLETATWLIFRSTSKRQEPMIAAPCFEHFSCNRCYTIYQCKDLQQQKGKLQDKTKFSVRHHPRESKEESESVEFSQSLISHVIFFAIFDLARNLGFTAEFRLSGHHGIVDCGVQR